MFDITDIREMFVDEYNRGNFVIDKSGVKLVELFGISFDATEETIFGPVNHDYVSREIQWYFSESLNVNDIQGDVPKIWKEVATPEGLINSNYGYLIFNEKNGSQYKNVFEELSLRPTSRRAVMIYTRPTMWTDYNKDGMSDFICTNAVQYFIRDNKLHTVVQMRSNDLVFGYRNDYAWQVYVRDLLLSDLNNHFEGEMELKPGRIIWNAGSLHVYERDFWRIDCWDRFGENLTKSAYEEQQKNLYVTYGK